MQAEWVLQESHKYGNLIVLAQLLGVPTASSNQNLKPHQM